MHHAWGRTYKDVYNRYFAMTGRELRHQNGFDCQGLWVEVEVEKELGLKIKRDIENLVPGDVKRPHRSLRATSARTASTLRPRADRAIDPPRLLDGLGPHGRGLGEVAGRAQVLFHDVGGEQFHYLELPQEVPPARPDLSRLRLDALVRPLRRRHLPRWR